MAIPTSVNPQITDNSNQTSEIPARLFHWASVQLAPGSVIEPGNWGRMLKRYSMPSGANGTGFGNPWVVARETLFEAIRVQMFAEKPSRLTASFSLLNSADAMEYQKAQDHHLLNILYEVELERPDAACHIGAVNLTAWPPAGAPFMDTIKYQAINYYQGNGGGLREFVSYSPLRVVGRCHV